LDSKRPHAALAANRELFSDWAIRLAGPARGGIYWYFTEVPLTVEAGGAEAEKRAANGKGAR